MFRKKLFVLLIFLNCTVSVYNQSCFQDGIYFSSQAQIDDFPINNPNCIEIGRVVISGIDIKNLEPLNQIQQIQGSLIIQDCPTLFNISIGSHLTVISDSLIIEDNSNLNSISGFNGITTVSDLIIEFNENLNEIHGFESLLEVFDNVFIRGDNLSQLSEFPELKIIGGNFNVGWITANITGFEKLEHIEGDMSLGQDVTIMISGFSNLTNVSGALRMNVVPNLESLIGFRNLNTIGKVLVIGNNEELKDFTDFESLESIGSLIITDLNAIIDFKGMEKLNTIENQLRVSECQSLQSLKGLQNVSFLNPTLLILSNNPLLRECSIKGLCDSLDELIGTPANNNIGCSSIDEILERCTLDSTFLEQDICLGETLNIGHESYTEIGFYEQSLTSCLGLDSVLNITIVESNECDDCIISIPGLGVQVKKLKHGFIIEFEDQTQQEFELKERLLDFVEQKILKVNKLRSKKNKIHFRKNHFDKLLQKLELGGVLKL